MEASPALGFLFEEHAHRLGTRIRLPSPWWNRGRHLAHQAEQLSGSRPRPTTRWGEAEEMELPGFQMGHEPSMEALEQHPIGIEHRPHPQVGPEVDQELLERSVRVWMRLRVLIQPCCSSRFGGMDHEHVRTDLGQPHGVDAPVRGMLHRQWMHGIGRHGRSASGWRGLNLGHAHSA